MVIFQKDLDLDALPFEVIWGLFFKLSSLGLGIYESVFHITVSENATIQTPKKETSIWIYFWRWESYLHIGI